MLLLKYVNSWENNIPLFNLISIMFFDKLIVHISPVIFIFFPIMRVKDYNLHYDYEAYRARSKVP